MNPANKLFTLGLLLIALTLSFCGKGQSPGKSPANKPNSKIENQQTTKSTASAEQSLPLKYTPLTWGETTIEFRSEEIPYTLRLRRVGKRILLAPQTIWMIDLETSTAKILFNHGVGPDEVYEPINLIPYKNNIYVNSLMPLKGLYYFNVNEENITIKRNRFGDMPLHFDDFEFIGDDLLLTTGVSDFENLIKIFSYKEHIFVKKLGKLSYIKLMSRFNVSKLSLCKENNVAYITESIVPRVQVLSLDDFIFSTPIKLAPPFYKAPIPKDYPNKKPVPHSEHIGWMNSWSGVYNIEVNNGWLMIIYRWGIEKQAHEFINLKNLSNRYYLEPGPRYIYHFEINGNVARVYSIEDTEDEVVWQKTDIQLKK